MKRIALDTDAVNRLGDTPGLLEAAQWAHAQGSLVFVVSHVVGDELAATECADRRGRLLRVWDEMPKLVVQTHGAIWDVSRWGAATWGDGGDSGITVEEARPEPGEHQDPLIATTASGEADILVTNDSSLAKKVRASSARCEVWSFGRLKRFIRSQVSQAGPSGVGGQYATEPLAREED